ncbi:hypothetical protein N7492_004101 [Penicillium capsulatum]|uniref:Xylanolytic transcriptional activator regulatory domain-containing protein n=1 Tax=Penicillium capsulatum TaxID=69766 RepID=A0A9W9IPB4_9EURO|nr:hypothetical protein N7492_004101 [Penicillium capsulatum]
MPYRDGGIWLVAFLLVGSATPLALTVGLNHDIPEYQCPNPVDRQHRIRLRWAIYVYDRVDGSKVGWPIQIADDDISVELPSTVPGGIHDDQFSDTSYLLASIELAQITGQVAEKVYSRKKQSGSFLQREQKVLIALKQWAQGLPQHLRLHRERPVPKHVISWHLQFHQSRDPSSDQPSLHAHTPTLKTLGDACIQAARHTHSLIVEEWVNGPMSIFGYFYAHYLFSRALIMVISSQVHPDSVTDFALFATSLEILRAMSDHDNLTCVQQGLGVLSDSGERHMPLDDAVDMPDETPINPLSVLVPAWEGQATCPRSWHREISWTR